MNHKAKSCGNHKPAQDEERNNFWDVREGDVAGAEPGCSEAREARVPRADLKDRLFSEGGRRNVGRKVVREEQRRRPRPGPGEGGAGGGGVAGGQDGQGD